MAIIAVLVILAAGAGVYYYINSKKANQSSSSNTPSANSVADSQADTSTWKTYSNAQFGFQIKYPPTSQTPKALSSGPGGQFDVTVVYMNGQGYEPLRLEINTAGDPRLGITGSGHMDIVPEKTNTFDGNNSVGKVYEGENPIEFTLDNNYVYANCVNYQKDPSVIQFCNQVLSTFKFTK